MLILDQLKKDLFIEIDQEFIVAVRYDKHF